MTKEFLSRPIHQVKSYYERYERYLPALFFSGGFIFDILTLDRIDSTLTIVQQAVYLILLSLIYGHWLVQTQRQWQFSERWQWYDNWRGHIAHFIFGSLLSSFTLFFFMSASISSSFAFLGIMAFLLVINEFPKFQAYGLSIKFGLLSLSWSCFFSYVIPTIIGKMGDLIFILSIAASVIPMWIISRLASAWLVMSPAIRLNVLRPTGLIIILFLTSYLLRIIPPVPLSIKFVGIYHDVNKTPDGKYRLTHYRPWWKFWQNGDQEFEAQPGDKIVVFFRLFSPASFSDRIRIVWWMKDRRGWSKQDSIPIEISGGRDEGFRGYGQKGNFSPGRWRAHLESSDGREIGRISFTISTSVSTVREPSFDYH